MKAIIGTVSSGKTKLLAKSAAESKGATLILADAHDPYYYSESIYSLVQEDRAKELTIRALFHYESTAQLINVLLTQTKRFRNVYVDVMYPMHTNDLHLLKAVETYLGIELCIVLQTIHAVGYKDAKIVDLSLEDANISIRQ